MSRWPGDEANEAEMEARPSSCSGQADGGEWEDQGKAHLRQVNPVGPMKSDVGAASRAHMQFV
jgi:hypothetical protein